MKYFTWDNYWELSDEEHEERYNKLLDEYYKISDNFPKRFNKAFQKKHFHDNIIVDITLKNINCKQNLIILMKESGGTNYIELTFCNIKKCLLEYDSSKWQKSEWILCEFLKRNKDIIFDIITSSGTIYVEFSKLKYRRVNDTSGRLA